MTSSKSLAAFLALTLVCSASPLRTVLAQESAADVDVARTLYKEGRALKDAKRYREAVEKFKEARAHKTTAIILLDLGITYEALGELLQAHEAYAAATSLPPDRRESVNAARARAESGARLAALAPRIPTLRVLVTGVAAGETAKVTVDGADFPFNSNPRQVNPGKHRVVASRGSAERVSEIDLREGEFRELTLTLLPVVVVVPDAGAPEPDAADAGAAEQPAVPDAGMIAERPSEGGSFLVPVGLTTAAVGLVGMGVGTFLGLSAKSKFSDANCPGGQCATSDALTKYKDAQSAGSTATLFFILGGVATAAGLTMWFLAPSSPVQAGPTGQPGAWGLTLRGSF
ncbi:MAG: tetratricopeptide repeat protein [Myxococcales bacterium]